MLTELRIKNFAIIESLTLPLARGFNVLSGETGAGKSIIVGALGLLLGERAQRRRDSHRRRPRHRRGRLRRRATVPEIRRCSTSAASTSRTAVVVLKREVAAGGARAPGSTARRSTPAVLAEVGRLLVNLHGQHEAQTLLDPDSQRRILDAFAGATEQAAARARRAR